jgi:hypothetical protein
MRRLLIFMLLVLPIGCRDDPPHPNQQAIDRAERHADEAAQQAEVVRQEAKHQQRLRDIDKVKFDSEVSGLETSWSFWRLWVIALSMLLVIALVWLAREVRLRRVLAHVLLSIRREWLKGGGS